MLWVDGDAAGTLELGLKGERREIAVDKKKQQYNKIETNVNENYPKPASSLKYQSLVRKNAPETTDMQFMPSYKS